MKNSVAELKRELMLIKKTAKLGRNDSLDGLLAFNDGLAWAGYWRSQTGTMSENFQGSGLIDINDLYKLLGKMPNDMVLDIVGSLDGIRIETNKGTFNFPYLDLAAYPECVFDTKDSVIQVRDFREMDKLQVAKTFVSKDEMREAMMNVYFDGEYIAATDAHKLYFPEVNYSFENADADILADNYNKRAQILINPLVADLFKDCDKIDIYAGSGYFHFVSDTRFYTQGKVDANFPNFRAVIPSENPNYFIYEGGDLDKIMDLALLSANPHTNQVGFSVNGHVEIISKDIDRGSSYSFDLPVKNIVSDEMTITFNGAFMADIIKHIKGPVNVSYSTPDRCAVINDQFLIMPVMAQ